MLIYAQQSYLNKEHHHVDLLEGFILAVLNDDEYNEVTRSKIQKSKRNGRQAFRAYKLAQR